MLPNTALYERILQHKYTGIYTPVFYTMAEFQTFNLLTF